MSGCSKLYTILKSPDRLKVPSVDPVDEESLVSPSKRIHSDYYDEQLWRCWECHCSFSDEGLLLNHLKTCNVKKENSNEIIGCPFCPKDINLPLEQPFSIRPFNDHLHNYHPNVKVMVCSYCLKSINSSLLEDLISHIVLTHKIPWVPSPASLAHMRDAELPHRVVTCLGCGWCTFVLRANNAAQPPNSLETHMNRCAFKGGQVHLVPIINNTQESSFDDFKATQEAEKISLAFARAFPLVRGYNLSSDIHSSPIRIHRYIRGSGGNLKTVINNIDEEHNNNSESKRELFPDKTIKAISKPGLDSSETIFDIPLTLPPPPPERIGQKKSAPSRLFVCPLCGDNALASLRERDEHLQESHNGELVFPCQLHVTLSVSVKNGNLLSYYCGNLEIRPAKKMKTLDLFERFDISKYRADHLPFFSRSSSRECDCKLDLKIALESVCGMAYPFYIALRRHAALQHDSDFDTVRYGPPDLLESEPIECPECNLVAFQDPIVLKLHINRLHKKVVSPLNQSFSNNAQKVIDSDTSSKTEDHSGLLVQSKQFSSRGRGRGRPRGSKTKSKIVISNSDLGNSVTSSIGVPSQTISTTLSELELSVGAASGAHSPVSCDLCGIELDNAKEFILHQELEHPTLDTDLEQLGCQACGRVFFGSNGRIDLIGHLRVLHQDSDTMSSVISCVNSENGDASSALVHTKDSSENTDPGKQTNIRSGRCDACFASPRLKQLHLSVNCAGSVGAAVGAVTSSLFGCPLKLDSEALLNKRSAILATEMLADKEGLIIVAYCCPECSRLFAGQQADSRFLEHRKTCQIDHSGSNSDAGSDEIKKADTNNDE